MQRRTVELTAGIVGIAVPIVFAIWLMASKVTEIQELTDRVVYLEDKITNIIEAQVADKIINEHVIELTNHVDWLRYHHHHENGEGHPHVD